MTTFLFLLFLFFPSWASATVLSDAIAKMQPNTWTVIQGGNASALDYNITVYADHAAWDVANRKFLFTGSYHASPGRLYIYDETTNSWSMGNLFGCNSPTACQTNPTGWANLAGPPRLNWGHAYSNNAIDDQGNLYYRDDDEIVDHCGSFGGGQPCAPNGTKEFKYNVAKATWSELPVNTTRAAMSYSTCCEGIVYFPDAGGLFFADGIGWMWLFNTRTNTWSQFGSRLTPFNNDGGGGTAMWVAYSAALKQVFITSQVTREVYMVNADGTYVRKNNVPGGITLYDGSGFYGNVVADPVSGKFVIIPGDRQTSQTVTWIYDPRADTWTQGASPPAEVTGPLASASDPTHGVILVLVCGSGSTQSCDGRIAIYKVSSANPDTDFTNRCSASGVVKCWGMDSASDGLTVNINNGPIVPGDCTTAAGDTTVKASGTSSLKFNLPASCSPTANIAGKWEPNGAVLGAFDGVSFGPGSTFYLQFKIRVNSALLTNHYNSSWKFVEILYNASIYGNLGIVAVNKDNSGAISGYMGASNELLGIYDNGGCLGGDNPAGCGSGPGGTMYAIQNFRGARGSSSPNGSGSGNDRCDYGEWGGGSFYTNLNADCLYFVPDVWQTIEYKITYGTKGGYNSRIEAWYMKPTDPQALKFLDTGPNFLFSAALAGNVFNTLNFSTYMTALSACPGCSDAAMWIDDVIISTQPISLGAYAANSQEQSPAVSTVFRRRVM